MAAPQTRQVYLQEDGPKFWDKLDSTLAGIRAKASGDAKMIARAFRHILEKDQDLHSVKADYSITDSAVEKPQQEVDDIIDANTLNTATSGVDTSFPAEYHTSANPVSRM
ncbi:hypothetical protein B0H14DRAFT_3427166 [Mycena olivaceomarginata]|nr:hypothetical protein B0H14DRAFT_3427166 [Mycena olivaceomarginata]